MNNEAKKTERQENIPAIEIRGPSAGRGGQSSSVSESVVVEVSRAVNDDGVVFLLRRSVDDQLVLVFLLGGRKPEGSSSTGGTAGDSERKKWMTFDAQSST